MKLGVSDQLAEAAAHAVSTSYWALASDGGNKVPNPNRSPNPDPSLSSSLSSSLLTSTTPSLNPYSSPHPSHNTSLLYPNTSLLILSQGRAIQMMAISMWNALLGRPELRPLGASDLFGDQSAKNGSMTHMAAIDAAGLRPEYNIAGIYYSHTYELSTCNTHILSTKVLHTECSQYFISPSTILWHSSPDCPVHFSHTHCLSSKS